MKILAIGKSLPDATEEEFRPHLQEEAARAWELYASGLFRELYFRTDRPDAVLVLECADVEEARQALDTLPLVREGLLDFDLIPLGPFVPFSRLFAE